MNPRELQPGQTYLLGNDKGSFVEVKYDGRDYAIPNNPYTIIGPDGQPCHCSEDFIQERIFPLGSENTPRVQQPSAGKEMVNHPDHYAAHGIETIEKMLRIWGPEAIAQWCEITAFKYRDRAGYKDDIVQDIEKALFYERKWKELKYQKTPLE